MRMFRLLMTLSALLSIGISGALRGEEMPSYGELLVRHKDVLAQQWSERRKWFERTSEVREDGKSVQLTMEYDGLIRQLEKGVPPEEKWPHYAMMVHRLADRSAGALGLFYRPCFIEEPELAELILARALRHTDSHISRSLVCTLKPMHIRGKLPWILAHFLQMEKPRSEGIWYLLAATDSVEARDAILAGRDEWKEIPPALLGRLGDPDAARRLIAAFREEKDIKRKMELASDVAFLNTPQAAVALAGELRSPLILGRDPDGLVKAMKSGQFKPDEFLGDWTSLNSAVVCALGLLFPDEPLLAEEWRGIRSEKPGSAHGDEYMAKVEAWCTENLGVTWKEPRPWFFWEYHLHRPRD